MIECGLTPFDEDLCPSLIAERGGIAFHNGLRTEARAQASPSRREIGDAADMERMPEKETPAPPQTKSVLGAIDGFKALTPSPKPLRESVIEVGAVEGPHIGDGCLTSFFEDFGSTFICQHGDIDMHNDLRDIARAQSSPSRREIDDNSEVERQSDNAIVTPLKTTLNTSSKADRTAVNDQPLSSNLTEPEGQPGASTNVPRTPQTKANGRQATNGSQPPCAIIEGVADGDDRTENDQSLRGPNAEAPPETRELGP